MGRGKQFQYANYVKYDKVSNISECLLCKRRMKSLSTGNIKRHYLKLHHANLDADSESGQKKFVMKTKFNITKNEFLTCCVGLVAVKYIPSRIFDDELYFKKLISPYEDEFQTNLSSKNIQEHLNAAVRDMRGLISDQIRHKMVCLKLDMVTRAERGILAVNIQYMENFKITIRTIGMIELHKNHSPKYLKSELRKCLSECNLDNAQVYSTTTDKGANVYLTEPSVPVDSDNVFDDESDWEKEYESIHASFLGVVKCASDSIHLAANYVIKTISENITECRIITQTLRAMSRNSEYEFDVPIVDKPGQWISTYYMIESLLKLKPSIETMEEKIDIKWDFATEFITAFKPLVECIKKVHEVNYIIGDFFRDWLCCEIELEEISEKNAFANALLRSMKSRQADLLNNEAFLSALYIDARFNFIKTPFLTEDQKQQALKNLEKTVTNLKRLDDKDDVSSSDGERSSFKVSSIVSLNPFVKLEEKTKTLIGSTSASTGKSVTEKLESLRFDDRLTFDTDILNHWRCSTYEDPEMRKLVEVVLSTPCTQVSVERTLKEFSAILANPGSELSNKTVNNMLMIKLNSNILRDVNLDLRNDEDVKMN